MCLKNSAVPVALWLLPVVALACGGGDTDSAESEDAAAEDSVPAESAVRMDAAGTMALLNPNDASGDELAGVTGMTPEAVAALESGRPFAGMADVHAALAGVLGEEAAQAMYEELWLPIGLNDAGRNEIILIPGVGERMAHEFEEYRPYVDMEQFRREIGKYVDEEEVARLERYVVLN